MGLILRSSSLANPDDSVTVKGSTLDWVEGDGNFVYLLNKINSGGGGSPAGSDTQIQYNNAGAFGADAGFTRTSTGVTNISSTLGTDTFGYQISDDILGLGGLVGSVNTWTTKGGDLGISGFYTGEDGFGNNTFIQWADGYVSANSTGKGSIRIGAASDIGDGFNITGLVQSFDIRNTISNIDYGISQSAGVVSIGQITGPGNGTKITIDDIAQTIDRKSTRLNSSH